MASQGGVCQRCEAEACSGSCCRDARALQIDHVNGDGAQSRRSGENGIRLYKGVLSQPERFQLLCANHNAMKRIEEGEHRSRTSYPRRPDVEVLAPIDRTEADRQRGETARERWAEKTRDEMAAIVAKRSAAMEAKRVARVEAERDLPAHPSWAKLGQEGCLDCGTHVKAHGGRGRCQACYMRAYNRGDFRVPSP